jgi:CheY-like chemotaxis protein
MTAQLKPMEMNKKPHVLLIDDDEVDVMGVTRIFKKNNISNPIVFANDGIEGLEKLRDGSVPVPRLVLLDLNMPRMNGIEFLRQLRHDPLLKSTIVFVLTTSSAEKDITQAFEHHVAGYIVKSGKESEFTDTAQLLEKYCNLVEFPES